MLRGIQKRASSRNRPEAAGTASDQPPGSYLGRLEKGSVRDLLVWNGQKAKRLIDLCQDIANGCKSLKNNM